MGHTRYLAIIEYTKVAERLQSRVVNIAFQFIKRVLLVLYYPRLQPIP